MNPKQFLQIGGAVLLLLGIAGLVGIFNKQSTPWFWLDNGENTAHVVLGVVALAGAYFLKDPNLQKWLVVAVGVFGLFAGIYGFAVAGQPEPNVGFANLESPSDDLLHVVVGLWALAAAFMPGRAMMPKTA